MREAVFGNVARAQEEAAMALRLSSGRDLQAGAALALAFAGDSVRARKLSEALAKQFPEDTLARFNYLPAINARLALNQNDAAKAIEVLRPAAPYELGTTPANFFFLVLYPVYVRGQAFLAAHKGSEAAVEFQKILDDSGIVVNAPIGSVAHLGLARAYVQQGDSAKARAAYQDFLARWKDADPDVPILREAKAEFARLK